MENHIKLSTRLSYLIRGFKISKDFPDGFEVLKNKLNLITIKNMKQYFGLMNDSGKVILPIGGYKLVAATEQMLIIFNESNLCMEGINLNDNFKTVFKVISYSNSDAEIATLYSEEKEMLCDYSIVLDAKKRYRVMDSKGYELASGLISYEKYFDSNDMCKLIALRYEDHFGLLSINKNVSCNAIIDINPKEFIKLPVSNKPSSLPMKKYIKFDKSVYASTRNMNTSNNKYLPLIIMTPSKEENDRYFFVGTNAIVRDEYNILDITSNDSGTYMVKLTNGDYLFFDNEGNLIGNETFSQVTNFVSNRAFVRKWVEEDGVMRNSKYFTLMDEEGRMITNDEIKIVAVTDNFKKRLYGSFMMTLAIVQTENCENILIDKEFHVYPELPKFSKN